MREKITIPIFVAMAVGGGIAFGTAGLAAAETFPAPSPTLTTLTPSPTPTSTESPTFYPPRPTASATASAKVKSDSTSTQKIEVDIDDPRDSWDSWDREGHRGCGPKCHHGHRELPMTGAPVKALAAAGAGMLLVGTAGTLIAIRRRRSASAK
jgi:LPXTG-motif cell wall-anchored protein